MQLKAAFRQMRVHHAIGVHSWIVIDLGQVNMVYIRMG